MVTAQELGFKAGEMDVGESTSYRVLRPQFESILSPAEILRKRFGELQSFAKKYEGQKWMRRDFERECPWNTHYFDTSMGAARTKNELILNPNSPALAAITPETQLVVRGIPLLIIPSTAKQHNRADYAEYINRDLRECDVVDNPFWQDIAEGNKDFLGQFAQLQFKALHDVYGYDEGMGIYFPEDAQLIERALVLYGSNVRANAYGLNDLDNCDARIVGVRRASGASASQKGAEGAVPQGIKVLPYTQADVERARAEFAQLRTFVKDEKVASLEALLRKL